MATKTTNGDDDKRGNTTHCMTSLNMYVNDKIFHMLGSGDAVTFRVDAGINHASNVSANDDKLFDMLGGDKLVEYAKAIVVMPSRELAKDRPYALVNDEVACKDEVRKQDLSR